MLMRGEDLSARYRGASFVALMPDTPLNAAKVAVARVSGAINHTDFTVAEVTSPIPVVCATATSKFVPGETPEQMIERIARSAGD